jgi:hypothetical protein
MTTKNYRHHHMQRTHHRASASPRPRPAYSNETLQSDNNTDKIYRQQQKPIKDTVKDKERQFSNQLLLKKKKSKKSSQKYIVVVVPEASNLEHSSYKPLPRPNRPFHVSGIAARSTHNGSSFKQVT